MRGYLFGMIALLEVVFAGMAVARTRIDGASFNGWVVCHRPENEFFWGDAPGLRRSDKVPVQTVVHPLADQMKNSNTLLHDCKAALHSNLEVSSTEVENKTERSELWQPGDKWIDYGSKIRYEFRMYIDPSIKTTQGRLVIGQWKGGWPVATGFDASPFVAQRFDKRVFRVSIEQDNDSPDGANYPECRVTVASQEEIAPDDPHKLAANRSPRLVSEEHRAEVEIGEDHPASQTANGCARDLQVDHGKKRRKLPNPFGHWVHMVYEIKGDSKDGYLRIYANGKRIVTVTGRIGFRTTPRPNQGKQYFKFGSYRDQDGGNGTIFCWIRNFSYAAIK